MDIDGNFDLMDTLERIDFKKLKLKEQNEYLKPLYIRHIKYCIKMDCVGSIVTFKGFKEGFEMATKIEKD